jgi:phenylpropionate dioxygenase-like ring-hydroxylating dioxygenase large terminal subunit
MVTRCSDGLLHVFSRACPHRGAELVEEDGEAGLIVCPYHSWSFDLAGRCRAAPLMKETEGFDREAHGLTPITHEIWNGFVFVNLSGKAEPLVERLAPLSAVLEAAGIADYVVGDTVDFGEVPYDWKILAENAMECYHHIGTHAQSIGRKFPADRSWDEDWSDDYVVTVSEEAGRPGADDAAMQAVSGNARIVTIFPNSHFTARPEGGTLLQVFPIAAGRSRVLAHAMVPRAVAHGGAGPEEIANRVARMSRVLAEDWGVCARVQKTSGARLGGGGRLSKYEHSLWLFYRYMSRVLPQPDPNSLLGWG